MQQFVKVTIGDSVSIHDVKFYTDCKMDAIPARVFDAESRVRLTSSRKFDKHYAYFPTSAAPEGKVGYIALTYEEYIDLNTKKHVAQIEVTDRPAHYKKNLIGYATRIEGPEAVTEAQEAQAEADAGETATPATEAEQEPQPQRPERRKNKAHA